MTPEQTLSPRTREGLISRFLGSESEMVYLTDDNRIVSLSRLSAPDGAVILFCLNRETSRLSAGIYSPGPVREVLNEEVLPGAEREEHLDSVLLLLNRAKLPQGTEREQALLQLSSARDQSLGSLSAAIVEDVRRELDTQDPGLPPDKAETGSLYQLLRGVSIKAERNTWQEWANDEVVASALCRIPDILSGQNSITITASPRFNPRVDLEMSQVPFWLKDSKGRVLDPHYDILPGAAVFVGVEEGQTYTVI